MDGASTPEAILAPALRLFRSSAARLETLARLGASVRAVLEVQGLYTGLDGCVIYYIVFVVLSSRVLRFSPSRAGGSGGAGGVRGVLDRIGLYGLVL